MNAAARPLGRRACRRESAGGLKGADVHPYGCTRSVAETGATSARRTDTQPPGPVAWSAERAPGIDAKALPRRVRSWETVTTSDGTKIFYADWGPRDAQLLIFHRRWALSNEDWDFGEGGLMVGRYARINDLPIAGADQLFRWGPRRRPDDHPSLSDLGL
ncbi:DUF1348 family protein [Streptomyces bauhiniae]|uniref:DUF1348 family protein n=1 Tax=Streptomyces bauhiniae TaxID=2340725 RepID=A0A7K3QWQ1_9ACTN|nr:DUF1348 family protein [Streptomyces bauhiniae]